MNKQRNGGPEAGNNRKSNKFAGRRPGDWGKESIIAFLCSREKATASEIVKSVGLARSTVYHDLSSLQKQGLVIKTGKHFRLLIPMLRLPDDPEKAITVLAHHIEFILSYYVKRLSRKLRVEAGELQIRLPPHIASGLSRERISLHDAVSDPELFNLLTKEKIIEQRGEHYILKKKYIMKEQTIIEGPPTTEEIENSVEIIITQLEELIRELLTTAAKKAKKQITLAHTIPEKIFIKNMTIKIV